MATLTLAELRTRVAARAAVVVATDARHTPTVANQYINESLEEYYLELTKCGHPQRVTRGTATTSGGTALSNGWPTNHYVALPADFFALLGAWRVESDESLCALTPFAEREFQDAPPNGRPFKFRIGENTAGTRILRLLPSADAAYTIVFTYIPLPTALAADGNSQNFFPGAAEFVVCDAALKILDDDGAQEGAQYQAVLARRERAREKLYQFASRQNRAGPLTIQAPPRFVWRARRPDYLR